MSGRTTPASWARLSSGSPAAVIRNADPEQIDRILALAVDGLRYQSPST